MNLVVNIAVRVEYRELDMYLGPGDKDCIYNYCTKTSWIMVILKTIHSFIQHSRDPPKWI